MYNLSPKRNTGVVLICLNAICQESHSSFQSTYTSLSDIKALEWLLLDVLDSWPIKCLLVNILTIKLSRHCLKQNTHRHHWMVRLWMFSQWCMLSLHVCWSERPPMVRRTQSMLTFFPEWFHRVWSEGKVRVLKALCELYNAIFL